MANDYQIGTTVGGMVTLASLGVQDPQPSPPVQYSLYITLGDGTVRGSGWLRTVWNFAVFDVDEVNALRAYMPSTTGTVYIKTIRSGGGFQVYSATYVWPQEEPADEGDCYEDFEIEFRKLVAAAT